MLISLPASTTLTDWSERTLWRRFSQQMVKTSANRATLPYAVIAPYLCLPLAAADLPLISAADTGDTAAQTDLALLFLTHARYKGAVYWLELAAKHEHADAMNLLGLCLIAGHGHPPDDNLGIMWIAKAAALGHVLSQRQLHAWQGDIQPSQITPP